MQIATVRMGWLTTRAQILLRDLDGEPPGDEVQDVLNDLTACPLVPAGDGELHDDQAQRLTLNAVAFDLAVAFAGSFASTPGYARNDLWVSLDDVLEGAFRARHQAQVCDGGFGIGCLARSSAVVRRCSSITASCLE